MPNPYVDNYHNMRLTDLFPWRARPKGEVGIEIEMEGGPWPEVPIKNWPGHVDNSLRNNGMEYVLQRPVNRGDVLRHLGVLIEGLSEARPVFSYRTSVHVHVNVQDLTVRQWVCFVAAFTMLEELLVNVVGPKRVGNKFCLRMLDADEPLRMAALGIQNADLAGYIAGDMKYASMNLLATATHGTLEFRAMAGNLDAKFINDWVQVLCAIKDYGVRTDNPRVLVESMSGIGPAEWAANILPRDNSITDAVLRSVDLRDAIYTGARLAQDLCYVSEWSEPQAGAEPSGVRARPMDADNEVLLRALRNIPAPPRWVIRDFDPIPQGNHDDGV